jgi:hypothetical protein
VESLKFRPAGVWWNFGSSYDAIEDWYHAPFKTRIEGEERDYGTENQLKRISVAYSHLSITFSYIITTIMLVFLLYVLILLF